MRVRAPIMKFYAASISLFVILFFVSGCVTYKPNAQELLYGFYVIKGQSMNPSLDAPTAVLVKPIPYHAIKHGDIVVFNYREDLIVHRAVSKIDGIWLTQGDSMENRDSMRMTPASYRGMVYTDRAKPGHSGDISGELYSSQAEAIKAYNKKYNR